MVLRVAAEDKLNAYFPVLWFNHVAISLEIDQARNSPPLSIALLTACTRRFIEFLGGSTVDVDAKLEKGLTGRIGTILHRSSCRDLDSIALYGWLPWKMLQYYIEREVAITTECNDVLPGLWKRLSDCDPIGHTKKPLREGP